MNKLYTYIPVFAFLLVVFFVENVVLKISLLAVLALILIMAKLKRHQLVGDELEYDDRVESNITKWSLRSMFILNTLLIALLVIARENILDMTISRDVILIYLLITLCVPFYIVPLIVKRF